MNTALLHAFSQHFSIILAKSDFARLSEVLPDLDARHPQKCLEQLLSFPVTLKAQDYHFQKLMAPVLRALCIEHLRQQPTDQIKAIYAVYAEDLADLAKNAVYSPTELISVLGHALGLSLECINLESARELVEADPDANINFKIYLDPKTSNHGVNAHYFVHPDDENSTFADGNCLYHAVAQCLKMQYMHEKGIQNTYYDKLFKYRVLLNGTGYSFTQAQTLVQRTAFFKPQEIDILANILMTAALAGMCITLSGLLALSIPLWMSISASVLMLGLGIKLANYENIGHASLMNP